MNLFSHKLPRVNRMGTKKIIIVIAAILMVCMFTGICAAASGGSDATTWKKTDWYKVFNFAVLAIGLFFILRKPVSSALNSRIQGIKEQLNELEESKKEAEQKLARYNEKFNRLEQETEKLIADYVKQGNEAKKRIIEEAGTAAEKLEDQARKNIENEFKKAREKLQKEILEQALAKAEEIIKSKITNQDQDRLVDEYLEKVVA